jgi:argininosuccinate synthase
VAPWREWDFKSREALLDFAEKHQIPITKDKRGEAPFQRRRQPAALLLRGKVLEDPAVEAPEFVHMRTIAPEDAPDKPDRLHDGLRDGRSGRHRRQKLSRPPC